MLHIIQCWALYEYICDVLNTDLTMLREWGFQELAEYGCRLPMKQLDVIVSPPAFIWDPNLTLIHVTFNLDPCDLWPWPMWYKFYSSLNFFYRQTDRQTDRKWRLWAHRATCTGGLKKCLIWNSLRYHLRYHLRSHFLGKILLKFLPLRIDTGLR